MIKRYCLSKISVDLEEQNRVTMLTHQCPTHSHTLTHTHTHIHTYTHTCSRVRVAWIGSILAVVKRASPNWLNWIEFGGWVDGCGCLTDGRSRVMSYKELIRFGNPICAMRSPLGTVPWQILMISIRFYDWYLPPQKRDFSIAFVVWWNLNLVCYCFNFWCLISIFYCFFCFFL